MFEEVYPTEFARELGESVGIVERHRKKMNRKRYVKTNAMMQSFQRMAVTCDFELALTAWFGVDLTEEQTKALQAIYEHTKPFALGEAADVVQKRIRSATSTSKEVNDLTNTLREMTGNKKSENEEGGKQQVNAGFHIHMAKLD